MEADSFVQMLNALTSVGRERSRSRFNSWDQRKQRQSRDSTDDLWFASSNEAGDSELLNEFFGEFEPLTPRLEDAAKKKVPSPVAQPGAPVPPIRLEAQNRWARLKGHVQAAAHLRFASGGWIQ